MRTPTDLDAAIGTVLALPATPTKRGTCLIEGERPGIWVGDPLHDRAGQPSRVLLAGRTSAREPHDREAAWRYRLAWVASDLPAPVTP